MDLPGSKGPLPFKTMDIRAAFQSKLSSQARKRKSSVLDDDHKKNCKALKLSNSADENEVEIIDVVSDSTKSKSTVSLLESGLSDCKENTDLNAIENNLVNTNSHHKTCDLVTGPKISSNAQANDSFISSTDAPMTDVSFSDDLNSSLNNSTLNSTLNITASLTDEHSVSDGSGSKDEMQNTSVEIAADDKKSGNKTLNTDQNDGAPKKKRKMSAEQAKLRAEEHEKKQKEKEAKRKELEAKKNEKQKEKERRQLERERISREKQRRKEEEELQRKERERQKQEKKEQEEKEKLERIRERELKIQIKQITLEAKMEEKKKKEEQKQKQLEERKKAEEEKKKAELKKELKEKEKKEKAKAHFVSFFVKKNESSTSQPVSQPCEKEGGFLPFQVSDDMILAPVIPAAAQERFNKKQLDNFLKHQSDKELYLQNLKSGLYKSVKPKKDKNVSTCEAEVILIDKSEQAGLGLRAKLLQFCENVRPPYWGTWRKTSSSVKPKKPFNQDEVFDYSVDSDDEWDEGGPGESLSGTEDEKESGDDDYEVDNEFFVPHGYLSAEEEEDDSPVSNDPEEQKAILKLKLQQFEKERKKKTTELKPIILGCYIENDITSKDSSLVKFLENYKAELLTETPILTSFNILLQSVSKPSTPHPTDTSSPMNDGSAVKKRPRKVVPEDAMPFLVQLLHANTNRRQVVVKEFQEFWARQCQKHAPVANETESKTDFVTSPTDSPVAGDDSKQISKRQLDMAIHQIASYGKCPNPAVKKCWWVHDEVREKYGLLDTPVPNKWEYVSQIDTEEVSPQVAKPSNTSIKQFLNP